MPSINFYSPQTGRRIKEDNSIVNIADMIESIYNALVVDKNAGMQLSGSSLEYYGATVADRPAANTVPIGAVFMAVNTQEMWQSNGTTWVVI